MSQILPKVLGNHFFCTIRATRFTRSFSFFPITLKEEKGSTLAKVQEYKKIEKFKEFDVQEIINCLYKEGNEELYKYIYEKEKVTFFDYLNK